MVWYGRNQCTSERRNNVCQWATVGGKRHYWKSTFELRYAVYLEVLKIGGHIRDWFYEPRKFKFYGDDIAETKLAGKEVGIRVYTPDFQVVMCDGHSEWHECKGALLEKDAAKLGFFRTYYPKETLVLIMMGLPKGHTVSSAIKLAHLRKLEGRQVRIYDYAPTWGKQISRVFEMVRKVG